MTTKGQLLPAYYESLRANRKSRSESTRVFEIAGSPDSMQHLPDGSIVTVTALPGSRVFDKIVEASAKNANVSLENLLSDTLVSYATLGSRVTGKSKPSSETPTFLEFSYGGKLISAGQIAVPELECMISLVPFAGGALDHNAFKVEQILGDTSQSLQHAVLIKQPVLNDLEKLLIDKFASDPDASVVADTVFCGFPGVVAGLVVIGLLFVVGRALLGAAGRAVQGDAGQGAGDAGAGDAGAGDAGAGDAGAGDDGGGVTILSKFYERIGHLDPSSAASALLAARTLIISSKSRF